MKSRPIRNLRRPATARGGRFAAALAVILAALSAACGGGEAEKQSPLPALNVDACSLVTRDEVTAAMAAPAGEPERQGSPSGRGSVCVFPLSTESGRRTLQLAIESPPAGRRFSRADVSSFAVSASNAPPQAISGLGDAAYAADSKLHVLWSGRYLMVGDPQFNESLKPYETESLKKVAQKALERLPK